MDGQPRALRDKRFSEYPCLPSSRPHGNHYVPQCVFSLRRRLTYVKGEDVRGTVLSAVSLIELSNEAIAYQHQRELCMPQSEHLHTRAQNSAQPSGHGIEFELLDRIKDPVRITSRGSVDSPRLHTLE